MLQNTSEMCHIRILLNLLVLLIGVKEIKPSKDALKYITSGFVKVLDECKHELNLSDQIISDLFHYWKLEYAHLSRDTGCAIICMSKKLQLMDSDGKLHHGNAQEFAMTHGAASEVATQLVAIILACEKEHEGGEDECLRVLEVAKCFRSGIHVLDWTPRVEVIVEEVLTEI